MEGLEKKFMYMYLGIIMETEKCIKGLGGIGQEE